MDAMADADHGPRDERDDVAALRAYGAALADAVAVTLGPWVERSVTTVLAAAGMAPDDGVVAATRAAGRAAVDTVVPRLRALFEADVDEQRANPLAVVRQAVAYPTAVLRDAGAPAVRRDEFAVRAFPDDDYGLAPATWSDVDPSLQDPGIAWGAAKAHVVLQRRRTEGRTS
jgi:hypothetical protein